MEKIDLQIELAQTQIRLCEAQAALISIQLRDLVAQKQAQKQAQEQKDDNDVHSNP